MKKCPKCNGRLTTVYNMRKKTFSYRCNKCSAEFSGDGQEKEKVYDLGSDLKLLKIFNRARRGLR
ncbi:hypothetical protein [Fonticella tunisiensis]|uniref:Uncharacterized protein n=1 Tax=Fonticella tunisiensis TaxID=1096341 RepID=A0A4R7KLJ1_9CLOT|nr:hypothetical protein [Fonticella tunisiensis]TDT57276.1 hypothetical protein EDD71_11258 [Fonticella tunisiensis]